MHEANRIFTLTLVLSEKKLLKILSYYDFLFNTHTHTHTTLNRLSKLRTTFSFQPSCSLSRQKCKKVFENCHHFHIFSQRKTSRTLQSCNKSLQYIFERYISFLLLTGIRDDTEFFGSFLDGSVLEHITSLKCTSGHHFHAIQNHRGPL